MTKSLSLILFALSIACSTNTLKGIAEVNSPITLNNQKVVPPGHYESEIKVFADYLEIALGVTEKDSEGEERFRTHGRFTLPFSHKNMFMEESTSWTPSESKQNFFVFANSKRMAVRSEPSEGMESCYRSSYKEDSKSSGYQWVKYHYQTDIIKTELRLVSEAKDAKLATVSGFEKTTTRVTDYESDCH